jgi:tRNA G18 (ribose-2'-O)-methylase SpoU
MIIPIGDASDRRLEPYRDIRERDLVGRDGLFVAEGKIVLSVLLEQAGYGVDSVLLLENRVAALANLLTKLPTETPVYAVPKAVMDSVTGFHVHRGVLAIGRRIHNAGLPDLIALSGADCLFVVLCGISNHDNIGSIFRNAAAFSVDAVILDETCCDPLYRKSVRVSVGGVLTVQWHKGGSIQSTITQLANAGFSFAALSPDGERTIEQLPRSGKRAILLGSEGHGLPADVLASIQTFRIVMAADFDSLNVATASGIALHAASRYLQRS